MTDLFSSFLPLILPLLPPLVAILIAVFVRNVVVALLAAIVMAEILLRVSGSSFAPWAGLSGAVERTADTLASGYNARVILFCLAVGALAALMHRTGGIAAFLRWLGRHGLGRTKAGAGMVTALTGMMVFIDTNLSIFTSAFVGKPLFDRFKLSRARLAYLIDSTCAPVSVLVLVNGWGAYALGLLGEFDGEIDPLATLMLTVPLNFYALLAIGAAVFTAASGRAFGPLGRVDDAADGQAPGQALADNVVEADIAPTHPALMLGPIVVMILGSFAFLYLTGDGSVFDGSGARAVLWSVCLAIALVFCLAWALRVARPGVLGGWAFDGVKQLLEPVFIILLSLTLGNSLEALGTGDVVAGALSEVVPASLIAMVVFVLAGFMAFTTGTSWGTFAIMFPIALPLALASGAPAPLVAAAILGGGVFGDHCSPISDTTVVSSLAAGCDHYTHVRTQLPYALVLGVVSAALYALVGVLWGGFAG